jgi:hypothetical protein
MIFLVQKNGSDLQIEMRLFLGCQWNRCRKQMAAYRHGRKGRLHRRPVSIS